MYTTEVLPLLSKKSRILYILFTKEFTIVSFSKELTLLTDTNSDIAVGIDIRDIFWEFLGFEENILKLHNQDSTSFKIPMIFKNSIYYDIEIEAFEAEAKNEIFIAYISKKSEFSSEYLKTIQEINKKTLILQIDEVQHKKEENYYDLINKQLLSFHVDNLGLITEANTVCCFFLGKEEEKLIGQHFSNFFHTRETTLKNSTSKIFNATSQQGHDTIFHADILAVKDTTDVYKNIIICQDVSHLKQIAKELEYAAAHDSLTGLPNQSKILEKIDEAIINTDTKNELFSLCYINISKLSLVNSDYGYHAGDMLLKHVASILDNFVRENDTVSRISGDEFIILLTHGKSNHSLNSIIERINLLPINNPLHYTEDDTIHYKFNLGICSYPQDVNDSKALIDLAQKAMKKERKKN